MAASQTASSTVKCVKNTKNAAKTALGCIFVQFFYRLETMPRLLSHHCLRAIGLVPLPLFPFSRQGCPPMSRATLHPRLPTYELTLPNNMQPPSSSTKTPSKPPPRRARSESDRKKHAGWRRCPRCARSVSTNGRNFYHHMHKCDRHFFADVIARIDASRSTPAPAPQPQTTRLTDAQRTVFLQQLCFLRIYDRTVDDVFRKLEAAHVRFCGPSVFETIRDAKRQQARLSNQPIPDCTPVPTPQRPSNKYAAIPLPETLASPMSIPTASPATPAQPVAESRTHLHSISPPIFSPSVAGPSTLAQVPSHSPSLPCSPSPQVAAVGQVSITRPVSFHAPSASYGPQSPPADFFVSQSQQSPLYFSHQDAIHLSSPQTHIFTSPYDTPHPHPQLIESAARDYSAPIPAPPAQRLQSPFQHVTLQLPLAPFSSSTAIASPTIRSSTSTQLPAHQQSVEQGMPQQLTSSQQPSSRQTSAMSISSVINK